MNRHGLTEQSRMLFEQETQRSVAGFGGVAEGPIGDSRGSWIVSAIALVGDDEILFGEDAAIDNDQFVYRVARNSTAAMTTTALSSPPSNPVPEPTPASPGGGRSGALRVQTSTPPHGSTPNSTGSSKP